MTRKQLDAHLKRLGACTEATDWVAKTKGTPAQLWAKCPDPRWLLWLTGHAEVDRKTLVLTACAIARTALQFVRGGEDRPRIAIETAEAIAPDSPAVSTKLEAPVAAETPAMMPKTAARPSLAP